MHKIPDCTHLSGISMVLFSFHQNEKNKISATICVNFASSVHPNTSDITTNRQMNRVKIARAYPRNVIFFICLL